jgi:hypothetical protein
MSQPEPSEQELADGWTVHLDADPGSATDQPEPPARLRGWSAVGLLIAVVVALAVIWGPDVDTGEDPAPVATVLGSHLAVPIALHLPADAVTTADGSYVGVQFPAGGVVLVTVPTQVVDPSGARRPVPADAAAWLARHPAVFVSRVRQVKVGGVSATQLDYRRSNLAGLPSRFARLPLFCGWRTEAGSPVIGPDSAQPTQSLPCTQITADARVRATFVRLGTRTVLVEAVWRMDSTDGGGRMPRRLQRSYAALLAGLTPGAHGK